MLLAASPTTPGAARRAATPVEASLAMVVAAVAVVVNVRCSTLCAPTVALTPRCRSARAVTGRSTAATVSTACGTKRGVVPLFAGVVKHLAVHSLTMAARCTFSFCPGGLEGIWVPLWQFQGFCVDLTHATWSSSAEFLTECWRNLAALRPGIWAWFHRYPTLRCSRLRGHVAISVGSCLYGAWRWQPGVVMSFG